MLVITRDHAVAVAVGQFEEIDLLKHALTFISEEDPLVISERVLPDLTWELTFLSGLLPRITSRLSQLCPYEVYDRIPPLESFEAFWEGNSEKINKKMLRGVELYDDQVSAITKALYHRRGIITLSTGGGKTEVSAAIIRYLERESADHRVIMVVPSVNSMRQTIQRFRDRGIRSVGAMGDQVHELSKRHLVAVVNSLYRRLGRKDTQKVTAATTCLLFMEAHHEPAPTWSTIAQTINAPYRFALSATPFVRPETPTDLRDYGLIGATGEVISFCPPYILMDKGRLATPHLTMLEITHPYQGGNYWQLIKNRCIVKNVMRNTAICRIATDCTRAGNKVLLIVNERDNHGHPLACQISEALGKPVLFFAGGSSLSTYLGGEKHREERIAVNELALRLQEKPSYCLIGSPAVHEDVDFPDANVLIMAGAGRRFRRTTQIVGRVLRRKPEPNIVYVVDFYDKTSFVLTNQANERMKWYNDQFGKAKRYQFSIEKTVEDVVAKICGGRE
jgi:superfamily II DNA or RNA helicase